MVNVNYQFYGKSFALRLRLYKNGEVRYISVTRHLRGQLRKRHWNQKRQCFTPSAPMSEDNNRIIEEFRKPYDEIARTWEGSISGLITAIGSRSSRQVPDGTLKWLFEMVIGEKMRERHPDGSMKCTYESYQKTERRIREYYRAIHQRYESIMLADLTPESVNAMLDHVEGERGAGSRFYVSSTLHSALNFADRMGWFDIKSMKGVRWSKKNRETAHKYRTLTRDQCNAFISMKPSELPTNPRSPQYAWKARLYHDFCTFILYTCQSPCDALCLKYSDIQRINGVDHFVFKRRKIAGKQSTDCSVPINTRMREIMDRWRKRSKDGYIFPVRNNSTIKRNASDNNDLDKFTQRVNVWLKKVGSIIGTSFPLHTYVFRHTGITHYISTGVPIIYVANLAGTSVKNCEAIYYNNQGDTSSRDMVLGAVDF